MFSGKAVTAILHAWTRTLTPGHVKLSKSIGCPRERFLGACAFKMSRGRWISRKGLPHGVCLLFEAILLKKTLLETIWDRNRLVLQGKTVAASRACNGAINTERSQRIPAYHDANTQRYTCTSWWHLAKYPFYTVTQIRHVSWSSTGLKTEFASGTACTICFSNIPNMLLNCWTALNMH